MNKYTIAGLSVSGGILTGLAWTDWCSGLILLVGLVPFFVIEDYVSKNLKKLTLNSYFLYLLPGFLIFTLMTIGWIRVISMVAAICVVLAVSFMMSFTFWIAFIVRVKAGSLAGHFSLLVFWLSFEFLCLKINILSPWLNLGNGLSKDILFIQWYEITGTAGGTLWIILSNMFLSLFLISCFSKKSHKAAFLLMWLTIVLFPSAISLIRFKSIESSGIRENEVVIVQPDFDPYNEKFTIPFETQVEKTISLAETAITERTSWIVTPETTVDDPVNENLLNDDKYVLMFRSINKKYPRVSIVAGMVTWKPELNLIKSPSDKKQERLTGINSNVRFNSAVKIDTCRETEVYHKSKLVPGFESVPANKLLGLIKKILPDLGGTVWGYGIQNERKCFTSSDKNVIIAPVICYESVFGEYVTDYVKKGAEAIFIITNDGWWKNTNGYKQHLSYASLRAIETRRPVVRAANTGISCFIDLKGQITAQSGWWERDVLRGVIFPETRITLYVKYGDILSKISVLISVILLFGIFLILPFLKKIRKF
jgi:apolipoprotein N-acyltransferase